MTVEPRVSSREVTNNSSSSPLGGGSDEFMQLLMTQLQSQDPLSPMDTNSFVSQLVQFNTLDEITQIRSLIETLAGTTPAQSK